MVINARNKSLNTMIHFVIINKELMPIILFLGFLCHNHCILQTHN